MSIASTHLERSAGVSCDCHQHSQARKAGVIAYAASRRMVRAFRAGKHSLADILCGRIERLNRIAAYKSI